MATAPLRPAKVVISAGTSVAAWLIALVFGVSTLYHVTFRSMSYAHAGLADV